MKERFPDLKGQTLTSPPHPTCSICLLVSQSTVPSCCLLCSIQLTKAIRIIPMEQFQPPPPRLLDVYVYDCINTVLFVSPQLCFLSSMHFHPFPLGRLHTLRGTRAKATSLKTIVQSSEGADYMLCERENEPRRPPRVSSVALMEITECAMEGKRGPFLPFSEN